MIKLRLALVLAGILCYAQQSFAQYEGGDNDGFGTNVGCVQSLNGTSGLIPSAIVGSTQFCAFATEAYSITVSGSTSSTIITWTVPVGATIVSGQGTTSILVTFGNTNGNVSVDVSNECTLVNVLLPVTLSSCAFFAGGDNDGSTSNIGCVQTLNGTSALLPSAIVGSTEFCPFATEAYSIVVSGSTSSTVYTWSVPAGATILSGQGTTSILVTFGNTNGNIGIDVSNECNLVNVLLPVTMSSCTFFAGGDNDGSASNIGCIQTLNGGPAFIPGPIVGSTEFCPFATEAYSIVVSGSTSSTIYTWTVPPGATITAGQGTSSILVTFGGSNGDVSVAVNNECETVNQLLPVTASSCTFFAGGSNDGFTSNVGCIQNLNGGSAFTPGPIVGSTEFCQFATEAYSIVVAGATSSAVYTWTGPPGSTITSGQGTSSVLITFGGTNGNVSVAVNNECETVNQVLPVTSTSCTFFAGGSNDGFTSNVGCIQNLNGGSAFTPGPIVGSTGFCPFATDIYTITVAGATSSAVYTWSGPPGSTITSGQGTSTVVITFGGVNGNISVAVNNECETVNQVLAVTASSCTFFAGGNNDGFTSNVGCIQNLNGGSAFTPGPIVGSTEFCSFASEAYTITVAGATASSVYTWSGPAGSTVLSGQGTNTVSISFGSTAGNVSVSISNECETVNASLGVSLSSCLFYRGGSNDGFSVTTTVNIPLPIVLVSFEAMPEDNTVQLKWITASEVDNNFFEVERSKDGMQFSVVAKIQGSGTTNQRTTYYTVDESPFAGVSYYRLSQTDFDGTKSYSKIIMVELGGSIDEPVKMYPNPIRNGDVLHFEYYADLEETVKVSITDAFGKAIETRRVKIKTGWNTISLTPDFNAIGVYVVYLQTRTGKKVIKLLVQ